MKHNYIESLKDDVQYREYLESVKNVEETIEELESIDSLEKYLSSEYKLDFLPNGVQALKNIIAERNNVLLDLLWDLNLDGWIEVELSSDKEIFNVIEERILDEIVPNEIEYYELNCHYLPHYSEYLSLDEVNDRMREHTELIEDLGKQWKWIQNMIINALNPRYIVDIDTSYKSISTYITCYTKNYHEIVEVLDGDIDSDDIADSLGTEFEYDEETFTIRVSDHEVGGRYDEYAGYWENYAGCEINILLPTTLK